ncbi:hypothetical protein [Xenorhabdus poinarii]
MKTDHTVPLSHQAVLLINALQELSSNGEVKFLNDHHSAKVMSESTVNKA